VWIGKNWTVLEQTGMNVRSSTQSQTIFDRRETVSFTGQICCMEEHDDSAVVPAKAQ
jgi:hypothetical protein